MDEISVSLARRQRRYEVAIVAVASLIAVVGARDYAGGWNDGSRLATVESLVNRYTLSIDDSIFVRSSATADAPNPYELGNELLRAEGTKDKLFIAGHYYSDKSPLPAFWLAGCYQVLKSVFGLSACEHPRLFCYLMTLASSGLSYVVSLWALWRLACRQGLPLAHCLLLTASLALATVTLPYVRQVNNHVMLLAVLMLLMLVLDRLTGPQREGSHEKPNEHKIGRAIAGSARCRLWTLEFGIWTVPAAGFLAGLGYTFDLGLGPVLLLCTMAFVAYRTRSVAALACFSFAALPCLAAHHAANYATGGTIGPANSVAEYLAWPGSPFSTANMTGGWAHRDIGHFALYTAALLIGKHGFLNYNMPLFLPIVGFGVVARHRMAETPALAFAAVFAAGVWLIYGALSNNYAGPCCSIRWFVPLLAPAYYVLALLLRERPQTAGDLAALSLFGALLSVCLWWRGPWDGRVPLVLWPLNGVAILAWLIAVWYGSRVPSAQDDLCERHRSAA